MFILTYKRGLLSVCQESWPQGRSQRSQRCDVSIFASLIADQVSNIPSCMRQFTLLSQPKEITQGGERSMEGGGNPGSEIKK